MMFPSLAPRQKTCESFLRIFMFSKPTTFVTIMLKVIKPSAKFKSLLQAKLNKLILLSLSTIFIFSNIEMHHAKAANALFFSNTKTHLNSTLTPLLNNAGATALVQPVQLSLELFPWLAGAVLLSIIIWTGVQG